MPLTWVLVRAPADQAPEQNVFVNSDHQHPVGITGTPFQVEAGINTFSLRAGNTVLAEAMEECPEAPEGAPFSVELIATPIAVINPPAPPNIEKPATPSGQKPARKKTAARKKAPARKKTAAGKKAAPKRKAAAKRKAAPKRKAAAKRKAAPKRKTAPKRKAAAKRKAPPKRKAAARRKTMGRKTKKTAAKTKRPVRGRARRK